MNSGHTAATRLSEIAAGAMPEPAEADHLLACPVCRHSLAERDPSALFALLGAGASWVDAGPMPALDLPPRRPAHPWVRQLLIAAAALLAFGCLLFLSNTPHKSPVVVAAADSFSTMAKSYPPVVSKVESSRAQILTLVPPGGEKPSVTLILGEEIDL